MYTISSTLKDPLHGHLVITMEILKEVYLFADSKITSITQKKYVVSVFSFDTSLTVITSSYLDLP